MEIVGGTAPDHPLGATAFLSSRPDEESHEIALVADPAFAHIAFKVSSLAEFQSIHTRVVEKNIPIKFVFNHRVSFAFYFDDPDSNMIEVYWPTGDLSCTQPYAEPLDLSQPDEGFYVSQLAVAHMRLQKSGHIVNISTSLVTQPIAGVAASLANLTKGGLESVTRALAMEFAREGIRFNTIAPGVVNTPMNPVEAHEFLRQLSPMNRLAEVGEVADLLLYLESAPFVNGEVIHLDGGAHAGKW